MSDETAETDVWFEAPSELPQNKCHRLRNAIARDCRVTPIGDPTIARVRSLGKEQRQQLLEKVSKTHDQDNEILLLAIKERIQKSGLQLPTVEVRFESLSVSADVYVGGRALPTLINFVRNILEGFLSSCKILPSNKQDFPILNEVSGVIKPQRMTLLLGPPGAGKTTLLKALSGKLDSDLRVSTGPPDTYFRKIWMRLVNLASPPRVGSITYNGHRFSEFVAERTCSYVSQNDNHIGELTVRETFDFAARCQGIGSNLDMVKELLRKEKQSNTRPDPDIDAFMKASAVEGEYQSISTDYILKVLGLDICADTLVGNEMLRGISGGQKKRVTSGEIIVGPTKTLFLDEISTGLDSSTTFQVVKCMRNFAHIMDATILMALLQPAPETFDLFDDVLLLAEGYIVYLGPRDRILEFFESLGFQIPSRKGLADFLQEVTSKKDQGQYWADLTRPYEYMSVQSIANAFKAYEVGKELSAFLAIPFDKTTNHRAALVQTKYALCSWELVKACADREILLIRRNAFLYIFRTCQVGFVAFITATLFLRTRLHPTDETYGTLYLSTLFFALVHMMFNGFSEMAMTVLKLPVFYKQRDNLLYPVWAFTFPSWILRLPYSVAEAVIWSCMVYYVVGLAPEATRFFRYTFLLFLMHQMAIGMFRLIGAVGRTMVIANTFGSFAILVVFLLGGFILAKGSIHPWWVWGFWISPLSYAQNAIAVNEYLAARWDKPSQINGAPLYLNVLHSRGLFTKSYWYWIGAGVLFGYVVLFNFLVTFALENFNRNFFPPSSC